MSNYYEILEVERTATDKDIKSAYRKLAKKWHPDTTQFDKYYAASKFKEVTNAYNVLSDAEARKQYDYNLDYEVKLREENRRREQARREAEARRREQDRQEAERRRKEQARQEAERHRQEKERIWEEERRQQERDKQAAETRRREQERQEAERCRQEQERQEAERRRRWWQKRQEEESRQREQERREGLIRYWVKNNIKPIIQYCTFSIISSLKKVIERVVDFILLILFGWKVHWFFIFPIGVYISNYMHEIPDREVCKLASKITEFFFSSDTDSYHNLKLMIVCVYEFLVFHLLYLPFARLIRYLAQGSNVPLWVKLLGLLFVFVFVYCSYDVASRIVR